jgi:hypothetical protein
MGANKKFQMIKYYRVQAEQQRPNNSNSEGTRSLPSMASRSNFDYLPPVMILPNPGIDLRVKL